MDTQQPPIRLWPLAALGLAVAIGTGGLLLSAVYRTGISRQRLQLENVAVSRARLIGTMARFNAAQTPDYPGGPAEATLSQVRDAGPRFEGFAETGEFVLARRAGDTLLFLLRHRHDSLDARRMVLTRDALAEPLRRAFAGESGSMIGRDYRGVRVLAGYRPIPELDAAIVAKIDLAEVRAPYVRAGVQAAAAAVALILFGLLVFRRWGAPILSRVHTSEARYQVLMELAPDAVLVLDGDRFESCNQAACRLFGIASADLVGRHPWDVSPPRQPDGRTSREAARAWGDAAVSAGAVRFEWTHTRADGAWFEADVSLSVIPNTGRPRVIAIVRDVSVRSRSGRALRESEELFRVAMDQLPGAVAILDRDRHIVFANRQAVELSGMGDADRLVGRRDTDAAPVLLTTPYEALMERAGQERRVVSAEFPVEFVAGHPMELSVTVAPLAGDGGPVRQFIVVLSDLTELRRGESERLRLVQAIEQAGEGIAITNMAGVLEYVNPAFERLTGYAEADLLGKNSEFLNGNPESRDRFVTARDRATAGEVVELRYVNRRADGSLYTQETTLAPMRDAHGTVVGHVAAARDVTEEIVAAERLRQGQKLEEVGQLAAGLAHDFNNLLTVVLANTDMLLVGDDMAPVSLGLIEETRAAAMRGRAVVERLMGFSRKAPLAVEPVDLTQVVAETAQMLSRVLPETIKLVLPDRGEPLVVTADQNAVAQVLVNLATNARDAMPDGGELRIKLDIATLGSEDLEGHPWVVPGRYGRLAVGDTGSGMSDEVRAHLFDPFFTTKPRGRGTGLGLAMVYGLLKQQGGFVHVYSDAGVGSTFRVYLPLSHESVSRAATPEVAGVVEGDEIVGGTEHVLVVDDDEAIRRVAARVLGHGGYTVSTAANGEEALERLAERPEIALVLSDNVMPVMGGVALHSAIRARRSSAHFILSSGHSDRAADPGGQVPSVPFLPKPWTIHELLMAVRRSLDAARPE